MENASDALIMAFAVMVFVIALTVSINAFSQVKATSDVVLYSADKTNFYEYEDVEGKASENREVGLETIIPTLYKYYKENYTVLFRVASSYENGEFLNVRPFTIYTTPSRYKTSNGRTYLWGKQDQQNVDQSTYDTLLQVKYSSYFDGGYKKTGNQEIFSFDLEEETLRHEPWTGSEDRAKEHLDCLLNGREYYNPNADRSTSKPYIDYEKQIGYGGFTEKYKNSKFIETVGEYSYSDTQMISGDTKEGEVQIGSTVSSLRNQKKKRIVIYTLIK